MNVLCTARLATCFCLVLAGNITLASPAGSGYHLVKSVPLGAAPGDAEYFDYISVDSAGRRIYIAHGAEVKVLDADAAFMTGRTVIKEGKLKDPKTQKMIDISGEYRFLDVYTKRNGNWQVIASQVTKIAEPGPPAPPPAKATPTTK